MSRAKLQQIFVIWKIFFAIGICSGLRSKTAAIIRDVNSAKSLSCDPAYVIMRLYRGSSAVRLFDKQIRSAVTIKSQAFRNGRSHQRTKSRAMRNYGRLAERSKAAVLKTVDVQASGGSNPSPSANASGYGSRRSQKGSLAQVPLPILFRPLPRPSLRYNIVHRNGDDSLRSSIPSSRRSSLRIPAFRQRCELRLEAIQKRACMRDRKIKRQFKYLRFDIWGKLLI